MSTEQITADLEQDYLSYYSKLSVALGVVLFILSVDNVLGFTDMGGITAYIFYGLIAISGVATIYYLFAGNRFSKIAMSKNAWTGTYKDEFLNTVNLLAYKIAFFAITIMCAIGLFGGRFVENIDTSVYSSLLLAIGFVAYGVTALVQLRENDE
jgi:hypothetical protein